MPSTSTVQAALTSLAARSPSSPTIICVGGTSGIGEAIARVFTPLVKKPDVHIVGRSETAASKIIADLKQDKPDGTYHFHAYAALRDRDDLHMTDILTLERTDAT